jgi:hypothetical protein
MACGKSEVTSVLSEPSDSGWLAKLTTVASTEPSIRLRIWSAGTEGLRISPASPSTITSASRAGVKASPGIT